MAVPEDVGVFDDRQQTVRAFLDEVMRHAPSRQRARLRELTDDPRTIEDVERLLDEHTRCSDPAWQPPASPDAELKAGDMLGAWRLVESLASGGMGEVFVAERADRLYSQRVAIKLMRNPADAAVAARMASERQLLAQLQHPAIARLYDGGTTPGGQPYLVMEFVDGLPLHAYCRERRLGLAARVRLFQKVCLAVEAAHRHLVVHCDLKPGNVLVREDGEPVLLDFGIARALGSGDEGGRYCTPGYASPELQAGLPVSTASDVYSLGVLLAELLAAQRRPQPVAEAVPAPSRFATGDALAWRARLQGDLDAIVAKACDVAPERRHASVTDLRRDLEHWLAHRPVTARNATPGYRLRKLLRRRWREFAVTSAVLLLSGGFVSRLLHERDNARRAAHTAEQVSDLLVSSFADADPKNGKGRADLSAREVLDAGAASLRDPTKQHDAEVRARLQDVLGNAYMHMGHPQRAEPLMIASAQGFLSPAVRQPASAARVLAELTVLYSNGDYDDKAIATGRRALALYEQADAGPVDIANALNSLGIALTSTQPDEAATVLARALALRRTHEGEPSIAVSSTLHNLGRLERHRGHWTAAESHYRRALAMKRALRHTQRADYESSLTGLAQALNGQDRQSEAVEVLREALALASTLYRDGAELGSVHNELASTLHDLGRWAEAAPNYAEAMRLSSLSAGMDSIDYAISLNNQASLDEDRGALVAAEQAFRRSLAIRSAALADADNPGVLRATLNLGRLLLREGRLAEAGPLIERGWKGWLRGHEAGDQNSIGHRLLHAEWLLASGDRAAAVRELDAMADDVTRPRHQAWHHALLADLANARGDVRGALAQRRLAVQARAGELGNDHVEVARLRVRLAQALIDSGYRSQAQAELARAQTVLAPQLAPTAPLRDRMQALQQRLRVADTTPRALATSAVSAINGPG